MRKPRKPRPLQVCAICDKILTGRQRVACSPECGYQYKLLMEERDAMDEEFRQIVG